jgi:hypothetical protein
MIKSPQFRHDETKIGPPCPEFSVSHGIFSTPS